MRRPINNDQKILIHNILKSRRLLDDKKAYVLQYSNGRCESSTELYFDEAEALIGFFQPINKPFVKKDSEKNAKLKRNIFGSMVELSQKLNCHEYFHNDKYNQLNITQLFLAQTGKETIYAMNEAEQLKVYVALQSKISGMKKETKKKALKELENEFEYHINND